MTTTTHKKWLDELTLELRLKDASGKQIGDALATVEEFVADSGQSPAEAFGTPRSYAAQLTAEAGGNDQTDFRPTIILSTGSLVVFLAFSAALSPWLAGEQLLIGGIQLIFMAALAALVIAMPVYLSFLLRHVWALVAVPLVGTAAGILSAVLGPKTADSAFLVLPPLPVLLVSAALMVALSIVGTVIALREQPDPVTGPLDADPANTVKARWFEILTQWLFPIFSVALLGFTALIGALS